MTHYIPFFTEQKGPYQKAVCGAWVKPQEHAAEPTCHSCVVWLEKDDADAKATLERWKAEDRQPLSQESKDIIAKAHADDQRGVR